MKVKNVSDKTINVKIGGKDFYWVSIQPDEVVELPNIMILDDNLKVVNEKDVESKTEPKRFIKIKWTYDKLESLNKAEQVKMLKELKVDKIPRLEAGRIKKILKLLEE